MRYEFYILFSHSALAKGDYLEHQVQLGHQQLWRQAHRDVVNKHAHQGATKTLEEGADTETLEGSNNTETLQEGADMETLDKSQKFRAQKFIDITKSLKCLEVC